MAIDINTLVSSMKFILDKNGIEWDINETDPQVLFSFAIDRIKKQKVEISRLKDKVIKPGTKDDLPELLKVKEELNSLKDKVNFMSGIFGGGQWQ